MVVFVDELVELELEGDQVDRSGSAGEPFLEGGLEAFDFALGLWVVGAAVLLTDAQSGEVVLEPVLAPPAGESGGEDHAVIGQS